MNENARYIGRFAPSSTGALHLGSVYTALASFLDAKSQNGLWFLRIDDLDTPRNVKGAADSILKILEALQLHWDETVDYQSSHIEEYQFYLNQLIERDAVYACRCSRKKLPLIYPQHCRYSHFDKIQPHALRLKTYSHHFEFTDGLQGKIRRDIASQDSDFIVKRKDGIFSYQFAVIFDDARLGVNHVVRGIDLLNETPKQLYLQTLFNLPAPTYSHLPIVVGHDGFKLSKQTFAKPIENKNLNHVIFTTLRLLKQNPPLSLNNAPISELLNWAINHWNIDLLKGFSHFYQNDDVK